jgi:hypothetical protein
VFPYDDRLVDNCELDAILAEKAGCQSEDHEGTGSPLLAFGGGHRPLGPHLLPCVQLTAETHRLPTVDLTDR